MFRNKTINKPEKAFCYGSGITFLIILSIIILFKKYSQILLLIVYDRANNRRNPGVFTFT